jgi:hypothetical protein
MEELNKLIKEYMQLHPNATNPMQWFFVAKIEYLTEMLTNANGRELYYVLADESVLDGGYIAYKEN